MVEVKVRITTEPGGLQTVHSHPGEFPNGTIPAGTYRFEEVDGHRHTVELEEALEPGESITLSTSEDGAGPHPHRVTIRAVQEDEDESGEEEAEEMAHAPDRKAADHLVEVKVASRAFEVKQGVVNGQQVGIVSGYLATWDADSGGIFGVPDQFVRGAFANSLQEHRARGNRQIRLKDLHGRVIGGFPIETALEDDVGLFGVGHVNLQTQLGKEAFSLAKQGVLTDFSVGFTAVDDKIDGGVRIISEAVLWEASIVDEPANMNARILEVKAVVPFQDLPLASQDRRWDARAAAGRVRRLTDSTEEPSRDYRKAFVWFDTADAKSFGAYKLPIADVVDGQLTAIPRAIFAAAARFNQTDLPEADKPRAVRHLERYYAKMDLPSPFEREERRFFGADEVKAFTTRDLESALRESGAFSKGAAHLLAARLTRTEECGYAGEEEKRLASILNTLKETTRQLQG